MYAALMDDRKTNAWIDKRQNTHTELGAGIPAQWRLERGEQDVHGAEEQGGGVPTCQSRRPAHAPGTWELGVVECG